MLSVLQQGPRAVGVKQSQRAVSAGKAKLAFVAKDAEFVLDGISKLFHGFSFISFFFSV